MKREKILRIRPFNMANFSGGSGYMPLFAMFGMILSFPAIFLLWAGMAIPLAKEGGTLDYQILKRRLNRIVLPICLVLLVVFVCLIAPAVYGSFAAYFPASLWAAAVPTIGMYCSLFFSAKLLAVKGKLSKGYWLLLSLIFLALIAVIGFFIYWFIFEPIGAALDRP